MRACDCTMENFMLNLSNGNNRSGGGDPRVRVLSVGGVPRVVLVMLCDDQLFRTAADGTSVPTVFDIPEVRSLGALTKQVRVHYVCEGASTNFRAKVGMSWSVLGKSWDTPVEILANQTGTTTGVMSDWYGTSTEIGLLLRFQIEPSNASGAAIESGRVTVIVEIELKG